MLVKTVGLLQDRWKSWSTKKKILLAIPFIVLIALLCVLLFWDSDDEERPRTAEEELEKRYKEELKKHDDELKKLEEERKKLESKQIELERKREEDEKKMDEVIKSVDDANSIDDIRDIHKKLLSG